MIIQRMIQCIILEIVDNLKTTKKSTKRLRAVTKTEEKKKVTATDKNNGDVDLLGDETISR